MKREWTSWYRHVIDAWQGSSRIQTFSHAAYRAYHNLIMEQFQSEDGMLPDDDKQLARLSRLGAEWPQVAEEVRFALESNGAGRLYSPMQYTQWKNARERHQNYIERFAELRKIKAQKRTILCTQSSAEDSALIYAQDYALNSVLNSALNSVQTKNGQRKRKRLEVEVEVKAKASTLAPSDKKPSLDASGKQTPIPQDQIAGTLPLVDGTEHPITKAQMAEWRAAFPAVDVLQQLREMKVWTLAHRERRKTKRGIERFIVAWLAREQDKGGAGPQGDGNGANKQSASKQRVDGNRRAIATALARRGIHGPWDTPSPDSETVPESGSIGGAGGVHGGSREAGPEILPPAGRGRDSDAADHPRAGVFPDTG